MDKRVYYVIGFVLVFGILFLFSLAYFDYKLTGKAIDDSNSDSLDEWTMAGRYLNRTSWDGFQYPIISGLNEMNISSSGFFLHPTVARGYVYVGNSDGNFYQLNASNINQIIAVYPTNGVVDVLPIVLDDFVYFGSQGGQFYKLNASNVSQLIQSVSGFGSIYSSPASTEDYIYFGDQSNRLHQLNRDDITQEISTFTAGGLFGSSSPVVANGYIYIGNEDKRFYQLNANDVNQVVTFGIFSEGFSGSSPIVANGYVYTGCGNGYFYQLNASNVSEIISSYFTGSGNSLYGSTIANGYVYVGGASEKVYQLNASNVSELVSIYETGDSISQFISASSDYLYVGSYDHNVYQLDANNISNLINKYDAGGTVSRSFSLTDDYLYFGSFSKSFYQLNSSNISLTNNLPLIFSNFSDNSGILVGTGLAEFNVTVENSNGTVYLNINDQNYSAFSFGEGVYQFNLSLVPGSYDYYWFSYGFIAPFGISIIQKYVLRENVVEEEVSISGGGSTGLPSESFYLDNLEKIDLKVLDLKYGGKIFFDLDKTNYSIYLKNINRGEGNVILEILPIKKEIILQANDNQDIDLNGDSVYDINLGIGEIAIDKVEVEIALKRKSPSKSDTSIPINSFDSVNDGSEKIKSFDFGSSRFFNWIGDLFNRNRVQCKKLGGHVWVSNLNFCVNSNVNPTIDSLKVLNLIKDSISFGKSFVQIEKFVKYNCNGCFYLQVVVGGKLEEYFIQNWNLVESICVLNTCEVIGGRCGVIDDGCGGKLDCGNCSSGRYCEGGRCIVIPVVVPLKCEDSDGGKDYFNFGIVKDKDSLIKDYCEGNILVEGVCEGVSYGFNRYNCVAGCEAGACLEEFKCTDDDPSNNIFVKGVVVSKGNYNWFDVCDLYLTNQVTQYYCREDRGVIGDSNSDCSFDCLDGACIKGVCSDSDMEDFFKKGVVKDFYGVQEDYCSNSQTLVEGICVEDNFKQGNLYGKKIVYCENGCLDGVCLKPFKVFSNNFKSFFKNIFN